VTSIRKQSGSSPQISTPCLTVITLWNEDFSVEITGLFGNTATSHHGWSHGEVRQDCKFTKQKRVSDKDCVWRLCKKCSVEFFSSSWFFAGQKLRPPRMRATEVAGCYSREYKLYSLAAVLKCAKQRVKHCLRRANPIFTRRSLKL